MPKQIQSLADYLGTTNVEGASSDATASGSTPPRPASGPDVVDILDAKQFSEAVLSSREFRTYIVDALKLGELPAAVTTRLMDYAWGQPVKKLEVKDTTSLSNLSKSELLSQIALLEQIAQDLPDEDTIH
jgi:hypothetical protein